MLASTDPGVRTSPATVLRAPHMMAYRPLIQLVKKEIIGRKSIMWMDYVDGTQMEGRDEPRFQLLARLIDKAAKTRLATSECLVNAF